MPEDAEVTALRQAMRSALTTAMKARDTTAVKAVRSMLGTLDNAEAVPAAPGGLRAGAGAGVASGPIAGATTGLGTGDVARRELTIDDAAQLIRTEIAERHEAAAQYAAAGHPERADALRAEADVLATFVPAT